MSDNTVWSAGSLREASGSDDSAERVVYVAEAYKDGERIEQLVHVNKRDAREDIQITASEADNYEIHERRLWLGQATEFHAERNSVDTTPDWP